MSRRLGSRALWGPHAGVSDERVILCGGPRHSENTERWAVHPRARKSR